MKLVSETPTTDLSGTSLFPTGADFSTIRSSDSYLVSGLTLDQTTRAYRQLDEGSYEDIDTFAMQLDLGDSYRIVFSTPETEKFLSNRGMTVYDEWGGYFQLILNDFGNTFAPDGTLLSETFTAERSGTHFLFAEFTNYAGDDLAAAYDIRLEKVVDVTPWDLALSRDGMGAKAVLTAGDTLIAAGRTVTINLTFATSQLSYEDIRLLVNGSSTTMMSSRNGVTWVSITLAAAQPLQLTDLLEVRFSGGARAGQLALTEARVSVGGTPQLIDSDPPITTPGNQKISGTAGADLLTGDAGHDLISGLGGDDTLIGGAGNDTLIGGTGADRMTGGAGHDVYEVDNIGDLVIERANQGTDLVRSAIDYTLTAHVENLTLTGKAGLAGTGNSLGNLMTGNAGHNHLRGLGGNDTLNGGAGNDTLEGGAGKDLLNGGKGIDRMIGGKGNDTYIVDHARDKVIESANQGIDLVKSSVSYKLTAHVENLTLTGKAGLAGTGNSLGNAITGNAGDNRLRGLGGNDTLSGGAGRDTLDGGAGKDVLIGGAGNDRLIGGAGKDILTGGAGADVFVFKALSDSTTRASGRDTITDFSLAQKDRIDLSAIDADSSLRGNQAFQFIGDGEFTGRAGELSARIVSAGTLISGDVNGDRIADFAILLDDRMVLSANSFIL